MGRCYDISFSPSFLDRLPSNASVTICWLSCHAVPLWQTTLLTSSSSLTELFIRTKEEENINKQINKRKTKDRHRLVYGGNRRPSRGLSQIKGNVKTNLLGYAKASLCVKPIFSEFNTMCIMYSKESYCNLCIVLLILRLLVVKLKCITSKSYCIKT